MSSIRARRLCSSLLLLAASASAGDVAAHQRSESFSLWRQADGQVSVRFTVSAREATRVTSADRGADPGLELARYLDRRIDVRDRTGTCRRTERFRPLEARSGYLQAAALWQCNGPPAQLVIEAFFDRVAEHAHFATLEARDTTVQRLIRGAQPTWDISLDDAADSSLDAGFTGFVQRGFRHIVSGPDHLLFLLVLLIACHRLRELFWAVTGFTAGHSLTLGLAAAGVIEPDLPAVEATIGLTIALVAIERTARTAGGASVLAIASAALLLLLSAASAWTGGPDPRLLAALALFGYCYLMLADTVAGSGAFKAAVTTLFGLVHGLGFATAFLASELGPARLLWPLAGFNLGVELGQLAVVAAMGLSALALRRWPRVATLSADVAAATACALGLYWFLQRGFG